MEIYKTYLRENSSTVMIEHYPLESLPQILNHANDMDFVWIDVDAIQRFQQEDVDDVLSTLPLCSPYGIHYVMDGEGLTVTQLAALSSRKLSPDRIRALIKIGLLATYQVVLKVKGPDGKEREIMMEWTSLNPGIFADGIPADRADLAEWEDTHRDGDLCRDTFIKRVIGFLQDFGRRYGFDFSRTLVLLETVGEEEYAEQLAAAEKEAAAWCAAHPGWRSSDP